MDAWAGLPLGGLEARASEHLDEQRLNHDARVAAMTLLLPEEASGGLHGRAGLLPRAEVVTKYGQHARCQGEPTRFEKLRLPDLDHPVIEMDITEREPRELAEPKSRAHGEDHHEVHTRRAERCLG